MAQSKYTDNKLGPEFETLGIPDEADLDYITVATAGTVEANKAVVVGADKNIDTIAIADGGLKLGAGAGTAVTATAVELNYNDVTTLGTVQASKALTADANKVVTWTGVPAANGLLNIQATATSTTPGSVRAILGAVTQAATTTTGTVVGVRGAVTAVTAMSNYAYGTQGKAILDNVTVTAGSNHVCGVMAQISGSGATFTNGHIAALICSGQSLPAGVANMIYCESGGNKVNAVLQSNVAADYFLDINNFESCGIVATAAGGTIGANPKKIKILVDGVPKYFVCADDWS